MKLSKPITSNSKMTDKFGLAASSNSGRVHVVPGKDGWSVKKAGATRASIVTSTKASALKAANNLKDAERIVVHKKDGTIQSNSLKK